MSEVVQRTKEDVEDIAAGLKLVCLFPRNIELVLDIDLPGGKYDVDVLGCLLDNDFGLISEITTKSAGGNAHWYLRFNRTFQALERMGYQAALGSDPKKEALSLIRHREGNGSAACAMFETKVSALLVSRWRNKWDAKFKGEEA